MEVDVNALLDIATDYLHFVTEFFEIISQSAPHIYHSALFLAPQSSVVRKLYNQQICSPVARVVTGRAASWGICIASTGATASHVVWSPCGQFIAAAYQERIQVRDSGTLESVFVLVPPKGVLLDGVSITPFLAFSPDGHLLACSYNR